MKLNKEDLINIKRIKQAFLNGVESYVSQHLPFERDEVRRRTKTWDVPILLRIIRKLRSKAG